MLSVSILAILICMGLLILRAITGKTVFHRILVINSFGTKTVLLIALLGFLSGRPDFLDLALVYALMNFVGTIAVLRFSGYGDLASLDQNDASAEEDFEWV
ncbi:MAG: monovalent cation/H+ antiporter complex subunit F [Acidobacteriota bacterium]